MVEPSMYFGIGFLVAALFALLFVPLVHNRAVRLTMRRLEAATPLTIAEIRADKDQLRAEFALSTRRLELSVEQMKAKASAQLAELGKKTDAINLLKKELGEKAAQLLSLEARDKTLSEQIRATEQELELKSSSLRAAERALGTKEAELSKLSAELGEHSLSADSQRVELASLRTQVEALKLTVADHESKVKETEERLARERGDSTAAATELTDTRGKLEGLSTRAADFERQIVAHATEAEFLNKRVQELEGQLSDQRKAMAERNHVIEQLRSEAEAARNLESELRAELADAGKASSSAVERYKADAAQLEAQLAAAAEERSRLQVEIGRMKREAESTWAAERVENALLRERINDVAAEVARLTQALEGPDSPIESMLALESSALNRAGPVGRNGSPGNGRRHGEAGPARIDPSAEPKSTLADRIRALQSSASRARSN